MDKPIVSEVPDSEEFTHFDARPGAVNVKAHQGYIELTLEENGQVLNRAYLDYQGASDLFDELGEARWSLWEQLDRKLFPDDYTDYGSD